MRKILREATRFTLIAAALGGIYLVLVLFMAPSAKPQPAQVKDPWGVASVTPIPEQDPYAPYGGHVIQGVPPGVTLTPIQPYIPPPKPISDRIGEILECLILGAFCAAPLGLGTWCIYRLIRFAI